MDYIWLSMTAVSLISAAGGFRRSAAEYLVRPATDLTEASISNLRSDVALNRSYACNTQFFSDSWRSNRALMGELPRICSWLKQQENLLRFLHPGDQYENLIPEPLVREAVARDLLKAVRGSALEYNKYLKESKALQVIDEKRDFEMLLEEFSPYLLATGLAIRVTKVTSEIRELKQP